VVTPGLAKAGAATSAAASAAPDRIVRCLMVLLRVFGMPDNASRHGKLPPGWAREAAAPPRMPLTCEARGFISAANQPARTAPMAKAASVKIRLVSEEGTGFFYVAKKNSRTMTDKLTLRKYDPKARKHVLFKEAKIK
jgi:large subunit ribosomal protein L33